MVFETGTVTNSHELIHKIFGKLADIGWTKVATLQTDVNDADGYDLVFYSSGEENNHDIYIRVAAGLSDRDSNIGDAQLPFSDGYTEFINGFAYQYFPSGGTSASEGFNEIGRFGPSLYMFHSDASTEPEGNLDELNIWKAPESSSTPLDRKKIVELSSASAKSLDYSPYGFDGYANIWGTSEDHSIMYRYSLYSNSVNTLNVDTATPYRNANIVDTGMIRTREGKRYIYWQAAGTNTELDSTYTFRFDVDNIRNERGFANSMPFTHSVTSISSRPRGGWGPVPGTKRKRYAINGAPNHRLMYFAPGSMNDSDESASADWTYFDGELGKWHESVINPAAPWELSDSAGSHGSRALFVTKERSGYEYDRLYVCRGDSSTGFASITIDDDGYATGSWTIHDNLPVLLNRQAGRIVSVYGHILYFTAAFETTRIYKWAFPNDPTESGSWALVAEPGHYSIEDLNSDAQPLVAVDHLCNRVSISEFENNTYWIFADLNRLVVVVKNAHGKYNYMYVGAFQPYASNKTTRLAQVSMAGATSIAVNSPSIFEVGKRYMISDTQGGGITIYSQFGEPKNVAYSEIFTVLGVAGNIILTTVLSNAYSTNSIIGQDPVPVMSRISGMEKAQTFDFISLDSDINDNFQNIPWRRYDIRGTVSDAIADASSNNDRSKETFLYSFILIGENDEVSGREVRGQLIDVYSAGTRLVSEEEIAVGSQTYIAFDIDTSEETQRIVVGPK